MNLDAEMMEIAKVFFQESREGLDVMETGLLGLSDAADKETINTIFRAAHSIKGGSATFGFAEVAGFTHGVETLLDDMRNGLRPVTSEAIQALLQSCDCLREMIAATEAGNELDDGRIKALNAQIGQILATGAQAPAKAAAATGMPAAKSAATHEAQSAGDTVWRIQFHPVPELLRVRNEPTRMFAELARLGSITVRADLSRLPELGAIDPELCYLSWDIELRSTATRAQIDEIFDWVDPACRLEFTQLGPASPPAIRAAEDPPALKAPVAAGKPAPTAQAQKFGSESSSIRVATDKLDGIINLVGELLITQSMLAAFADGLDPSKLDMLRKGLSQLARNTRELQESVMQIRMLPISFAFNRFPRLVHDLSRKLGKSVEIKLSGENTELDKTVLEKISDPLVHLVRNALDHGLETPEQRVAKGKPPGGTIELSAFHEGGSIVIEVSDDGAGLNRPRILQKARERNLIAQDQDLTDEQIDNLIFMAGFSTAEQISDVSGRGVGMDVVLTEVQRLGGEIETQSSPGHGARFTLRLPLTAATQMAVVVRAGGQSLAVPERSVSLVAEVERETLPMLDGRPCFAVRGEEVPVIGLAALLWPSDRAGRMPGPARLLVVTHEDASVALEVDQVLRRQDLLLLRLHPALAACPGVAGAAVLGDGEVVLLLDPAHLVAAAHATAWRLAS